MDDSAEAGAGRPTARDGAAGDRPTRREDSAGAAARPTAREGNGGAGRPTARESGAPRTGRRRYTLPDRLADLYEYEADLGLGSQGPVLLCIERRTGKRVAVKLYHGEGLVDRDVLKALGGGNGAHVVVPIDFGVEDGEPWEIMEYFELGALDGLMRRGEVGGDRFARAFVAEITDAVEHLHTLGIKHRDLKPANVFVRSLDDLDVVIGDFGISIRSAATVAATVRGTWAYAAPEAGSPLVKEEADWWSVGIMVHELLTGRHPLAEPDGRLPPDNQLRAGVFSGAIDASAVDDPRWRLLLDGLLTWEADHRWGAEQVREWIAGRSPEVHRGKPGPGRQAVSAHVKPFPIAGVGHTDPVALTRAMIDHWEEAADRLRGRGIQELRVFLQDNGIDDARTHEIADRGSESYVILALQGAFLPGVAPQFRGRSLDGAALAATARAAQQGDADAAVWIRGLRLERVLGEVARYGTDAGRLAVADDHLARWGEEADGWAARLESDADLASIVPAQRDRWEGALLLAALDDDVARDLRTAGRTQGSDRAPIPDWAESLHERAERIGADRAADTATALIATTLLPAGREVEQRRRAALAKAEAERRRAAAAAERAAEKAARAETVVVRRQRAGREFWRRLWVIVPYSLAAGWISTVPLGEWEFPFATAGYWVSAAWAGVSALLLSLGVFLWETFAGRVRLFARTRLLIAAALTTLVLWWAEHPWFEGPPPLTAPTWWVRPAVVFAIAFLVAVVLSRLFGPRLGPDADRAADDRAWRQGARPRRLRILAGWTTPATILAGIALAGHAASAVAAQEGRTVQDLVGDVAPPWLMDAGTAIDGWLPALPLGGTGGGLFAALAAVCGGVVMTRLYLDIHRRSAGLAAWLLVAALVFALYVVVASPWEIILAGTLVVFGAIGIAIVGAIIWFIASVVG